MKHSSKDSFAAETGVVGILLLSHFQFFVLCSITATIIYLHICHFILIKDYLMQHELKQRDNSCYFKLHNWIQ